MESGESAKVSSLRWGILRRALLHRSATKPTDDRSNATHKRISRKSAKGFNLLPFCFTRKSPDGNESGSRDVCLRFTLPVTGSPSICLYQRMDDDVPDLQDFEICNKYNIDNTGLVCRWPSEDVLAYYCLNHPDIFRSKTVIELGSGYGLAGLVIGAINKATKVTITDGNPQVVDYIQHNINVNSDVFGSTEVTSMLLHWNECDTVDISGTFDVIVASDCTFFKEFHKGLARTVKSLLRRDSASEAIFFNPKRGDSLDKFITEIKENGLQFTLTENYDPEVWKLHQEFVDGTNNESWPNYQTDHCYPLLLRITL
ncbi:calmodulin-lysine N-methyltransferase [Impatiens glandulifera]|uniref:calmodulin-lysine N-methyltransferase n=1 Tax=Impatiens glandulifera TaxID=253017 RepID=UPI001FB118F7|nr:calmodulin-lysine N-methyltransferase [Impatiens glandulifera]